MSTTQDIPTSTRRLPVWVAVTLGILIAVAGIILVTRPFASIGVLIFTLASGAILAAVVEFIAWATTEKREGRWVHLVLGAVLLVLGVLILAVPGITVGLVTTLFGAALIVLGAVHLYRAFTAREARAALALGGSAAIIFGIIALAWPDITVLTIGALFGVWLLMSGTRLIVAAARKERFRRLTPPRRTWVRTVLAATALVAAVTLAFGSARISGTPSPDDFYAAPAEVPDQPGELLRAEPLE